MQTGVASEPTESNSSEAIPEANIEFRTDSTPARIPTEERIGLTDQVEERPTKKQEEMQCVYCECMFTNKTELLGHIFSCVSTH